MSNLGRRYAVMELNSLIGKRVKESELSNIVGVYMILLDTEIVENDDVQGTLVYAGDGKNEDYKYWFNQTQPITPIYNRTLEEEDSAVYDE